VYKLYSARQLIDDFPEKVWKLRSLNYLLKKLCETDVTHVDYDKNVYAAFHKALYWHSSRDAAELDAIWGKFIKGYVCQKLLKYSLVLQTYGKNKMVQFFCLSVCATIHVM